MAKVSSFGLKYSDALLKLRLGDHNRPDEIFPRFEKQSFDDLKKEYTDKYGYTIRIPKIEDVIHLTPNLMKSAAEIKAEKRKGLMNILASPAPDFARKYSSIMTYMDNIQDATSIVYPAIAMLTRLAPKVFGKILPVMGWVMLGTDLLNWAVQIGRLPFTPGAAWELLTTGGGPIKTRSPFSKMTGKRLTCHWSLTNPFTKTSQYLRKERLKNYKPGVADLLQVMQTTDQITGVGLNLGPIMGTIMDLFFGAYHYIKGDPVRFAYDVPDMFEHEKLAGRALTATGIINSTGQTFDDETHFWSLVIGAAAARIFTPVAHDFDICGAPEDPMNIMVPAAVPTDPLTIEVIKEAGLNVEDGVGWPYNGQKEIALGDLWDELIPRNRDVFRDFCFRHSQDWLGYVVASLWDQVTPSMIFGFDPTGSMEQDDTTEMKTLFKMVKAAILPTATVTQTQSDEFWDWVNGYRELYDEIPKIREIKDKLTQIGISIQNEFSLELPPGAEVLWPSDFPISDYTY